MTTYDPPGDSQPNPDDRYLGSEPPQWEPPRNPPDPPNPPDNGNDGVEREYSDRDVERDRGSRWIFFIFVVFLLTVLFPFVLSKIFPEWMEPYVFLLLIGAGIKATAKILPKISVYVPLAQGAVLLNAFSGKPSVYGGGWHPRFPWEQIEENSHHTLEIITLRRPETFDCQDGEMSVTFEVLFQPELPQLHKFLYVGENTIDEGFVGKLSQYLSQEIGPMTTEHARLAGNYLSQKAMRVFGIPIHGALPASDAAPDLEGVYGRIDRVDVGQEGTARFLERRYGIRFAQLNVSDIDYPEDIKKARGAVAESEQLLKIAEGLRGVDRGLLDRAAVLSGNATQRVLTVEGSSPFDAAVADHLGRREDD